MIQLHSLKISNNYAALQFSTSAASESLSIYISWSTAIIMMIVICGKDTVSVSLVTNKIWIRLPEELACSGSQLLSIEMCQRFSIESILLANH